LQGWPQINTPEALKITGASEANFRRATDLGTYTCAPPVVGGRRHWELDDLLCLTWFNALCTGGMKRPMAGELAALLQQALKQQPTATSFDVVVWEEEFERGRLAIGTEPPADAPTSAQVIFTIPVKQWRKNIAAAVKDFDRRRAAHHAKRQ
jgi:hypothetical protein